MSSPDGYVCLHLQKASLAVRHALGWFAAQALASNDPGLLKIYRQHFVTHPMQEFAEPHKREQRKADKAKVS